MFSDSVGVPRLPDPPKEWDADFVREYTRVLTGWMTRAQGGDLSKPPAIGSTTPNAVNATTLFSSGLATLESATITGNTFPASGAGLTFNWDGTYSNIRSYDVDAASWCGIKMNSGRLMFNIDNPAPIDLYGDTQVVGGGVFAARSGLFATGATTPAGMGTGFYAQGNSVAAFIGAYDTTGAVRMPLYVDGSVIYLNGQTPGVRTLCYGPFTVEGFNSAYLPDPTLRHMAGLSVYSSVCPFRWMTNASAASDQKMWDEYAASDGSYHFRCVNDLYNVAADWMVVGRTGFAPAHVTVPCAFLGATIKATTVGGYQSSDGSTGYTGTVTTASLVGKTITIKDGIITAFA